MTADLQALAERLDTLETQVRRMRRVAAALGLGLAGTLAMGAASATGVPDTIEARQFVARDGKGNARMVVGVDAHGAGFLSLEDSDGSSMFQSQGDAYLRTKGLDPEGPPETVMATLKARCEKERDGEACYGVAEMYDPKINIAHHTRFLTNAAQAVAFYAKACAVRFEPGCRRAEEQKER